MNSSSIAVIGAGSWGTSLALLWARNFQEVRLWGHNPEHIKMLRTTRVNNKYLKGFPFPENIIPVSDIKQAIASTKIILMVVPSHSLRQIVGKIEPLVEDDTKIISAIKGIENNTLQTMTQVMEDILHDVLAQNRGVDIGVLSGPSFAEEVARGIPTAVTLGFRDLYVAKQLQKVLATDFFRIYTSRDIIGLEISAALKNIIAIATGVCEGLGYGLNTRAALITRGLAEIRRFGLALGADDATFSGLSGLGDLILTCTGNLSRNRKVGLMLGQGKSMKQVENEMKMVAEGIKTTKSVYDLAKKIEIEMPILEQIHSIIYKEKKCSEAVKDLLKRELREE